MKFISKSNFALAVVLTLTLFIVLTGCDTGVVDDVVNDDDPNDLTEAETINTFESEDENYIWSLDFSADDSQLIAGGDKNIKIRDLETGDIDFEFTEHTETTNQVAYSSDSTKIVSCAGDLGGGEGIVWNSETGEIISSFEYDGALTSVTFSPDDSLIAFSGGYNNNAVTIVEADTGDEIKVFSENVRMTDAKFTSDGEKIIAGTEDDRVLIWEYDTGELIDQFTEHTGEVYTIDISSDDSKIVSGGLRGDIMIWDLETGNILNTYDGHDGIIEAVLFSADDSNIISGSRDNTVKIWDAETGQTIVDYREHEGNIRSIASSSDDRIIASGDQEGIINVWKW